MIISHVLRNPQSFKIVKSWPTICRHSDSRLPLIRRISSTSADSGSDGVVKINTIRQGLVELGLDHGQVKNALSASLVTQLSSKLDIISRDSSVKVVILRSRVPGVFCAGADLTERLAMSDDEVHRFVDSLRALSSQIAGLRCPTVAAIDGAALGGGLELALACDMRVAADTARLGLVETKLAIIPGAGGTQRLPRLIGPARARELIYTGRVISGCEAAKIGLVNLSTPQNETRNAAFDGALALAAEILPQSAKTLHAAKAAINAATESDISSGLATEGILYQLLIPSPNRKEALTAFKEKRAPKFID